MVWNWQQPSWPSFTWHEAALARAERLFAEGAGLVVGAGRHLGGPDRDALLVEVMSLEALDTAAIEGEHLDRDSVQSSIRRQLGLAADRRNSGAAETGHAEMMVDLYRNLAAPLDHETLFAWHRMVTNGRRDLTAIGRYRIHPEPMQIVSGASHAPRVHFEAPPSAAVPAEMARFLAWIDDTGKTGRLPLPPVTRAGLAHLWFESIHPFEDGNGRIGRAIVEKILAQGLSYPSLTAMAGTFLRHRKAYYRALELGSRDLDATNWLLWFAAAAIEAQRYALAQVEHVLHKASLMSRLQGHLNPRQEKILLRLFAAGPAGFSGGLSAGNVLRITQASTATTTRDLAGLVELGALERFGLQKATRYRLAIPEAALAPVLPEDIR